MQASPRETQPMEGFPMLQSYTELRIIGDPAVNQLPLVVLLVLFFGLRVILSAFT